MNRKVFAFALVGFLFVSSCTKPEEQPSQSTTDTTSKDAVTLSSQNSIVLPVEGGSATISFTASGDWTAAVANDRGSWLSISPASGGKDEGSVTVSAQANPDTDDRSAVVLLTCGKASARVTVTQKQKDAIVVTQPVHEIGANGGSISIEAAANVDLSVQISESWVRQAGTRAMTAASYDFEVDPNPGYEVRECVITFSAGAAEQENGFTQASSWSVIGTIGGDVWTRELLRRQAARRVPLRLPDGSTLPEPKHTPPQRVME